MPVGQEIKQAICDAVWSRQIDQMSTREVAEQFSISTQQARTILFDIIEDASGDERFHLNVERGSGVFVSDGYTFNYSPMDMNEGGMSTNAPKHYIWFCD